MSTRVQLRRGNTTQHSTFTGAVAEVTVDTEKKTIIVHDGSTAGGMPLVSTILKDNIIPASDNTYSLGNSTNGFAELYVSGNTIFIGDQTISSNATGVDVSGELYVSGELFVGGSQLANSTQIAFGSNVVLNTSELSIGNSTVNSVINSSSVSTGNVFANSVTATGDVSISGNLTVSGTTTYINTTELDIGDNIIKLNADLANTAPPSVNAGFEINRGNANTVSLLWNETSDEWQTTADGVTFVKIASNNDVSTAYSNATTFAANADNITSGTLNANRLPTSGVTANTYGNASSIPVLTIDATGRITNASLSNVAGVTNVVYTESNTTLVVSTGDGSSFTANFGTANSTYNGFIKVIDSVSNTSNITAAAANSVKVAYDAALNAYSNATIFASNGDNITSGTVAGARLASANDTVQGAVIIVNSVSNTSITATATANNVKTAYDAALNAYSNAVTYASNADNISSGTLNTARLPSTANISTAINVGANVNLTASGINVGNTTVNVAINSSSISVGPQTITSNSEGFDLSGNTLFVSGIAVGNTTISGEGFDTTQPFAVTNTLSAGNTTITGFANVTGSIAGGSLNIGANVIANTTSIKVGNGTTNTIITKNSIDIGNSSVNAIVNSTAFSLANATFTALITPSTITIDMLNATSVSGNGAGLTTVNAATLGGNTATDLQTYADNKAANAYSNATAFAANADNISSGTLNTARLPATANISTAINIGANVNLSTSQIIVGNSTVNSTFSAAGIATDGTLSVSGISTFTNTINVSNNVIANVAEPTESHHAATKFYVDSLAEGLHIHAGVDAATPNSLATITGGSVTYNNGTSGVGATLTLGTALTTLDGYALQVSDRVLVKNEANLAHNGIYVYSNSTVLTRATDYDSDAEIAGGDFVFVVNGTLYNSTGWVQTDPVNTIGTDKIEWVQFSGAGVFTAGDYLYLDGNQFNVNASSNSVASVVVVRDSNQNFSANTITANLIGTANNANNLGGQLPAYYTNATNISTGTLDTARLPATANVSTAINVGANVNLSTSQINVGNSTVNSVITSMSMAIGGSVRTFASHTTSNTSSQVFTSFDAATYRSAHYMIQMTSNTDYHTIQLSLIHDGSNVYLSQYGEIFDNTSLGAFDASIAGGTLSIFVTPVNAVTAIKAAATLITV